MILLRRLFFLGKEAEEFGINLIYDVAKLLGIVLEVEVIHFYHQHPTLILIHNEIIIKAVDAFQVVDRHALFIGRDYEQKMPIDYLEGINLLYDDFIMNKYKGRVLVVEVDNLDFEHNPKQFGDIIDKIDAKLFGFFS